jgi:hypothetical protein
VGMAMAVAVAMAMVVAVVVGMHASASFRDGAIETRRRRARAILVARVIRSEGIAF